MKIACIAWGSLIWNPKKLKVEKKWLSDGPLLPIEFTRLMTTEGLEDAIDSLQTREDTRRKNIHFINSRDIPEDPIKLGVRDWLRAKELDAAIWTGLSFSSRTGNQRPSIQEIVAHLNNLNAEDKRIAEEYIARAPVQIDTEFRRAINNLVDWVQQ